MSRKGKRACEGSQMTLANPRNPRNGTARARQRLEPVRIDDRDDDIRADTVRMVDTIELLHRRRQIDDRQRRGADRTPTAQLCRTRGPAPAPGARSARRCMVARAWAAPVLAPTCS